MKVSIIYRENNIYKKYMPMIQAVLLNLGFEIELVKVFSKETVRKEVRGFLNEWVEKINLTFEKKEALLLHDEPGNVKGLNIDHVLGDVVLRSHFGKKYDRIAKEYQGHDLDITLSNFKEMFPWLIKEIIKNDIPRIIYISKERLLDHAPLCYLKKGVKSKEEKAFEVIADLLIESGFSKEDIFFSGRPKNEKDAWVIQDRHSGRKYSKATLLRLPLSNFCLDAFEAGLIPCEVITAEALRDVLKERYW